jgi:hypothetical protein
MKLNSGEGHIEGAADRPEHHHEGRGREQSMDDTADEIHWAFGGDAQVVGDTVLGIGMISFDQVELVVSAVAEPAVDQLIVEPGALAALDRHAKVHLRDAEKHTDGKNCEIEE